MQPQQAAAILATLAQRMAEELQAALEAADIDAKALIYSSGDLEVLEAIEAGRDALSAAADASTVALSEPREVKDDGDPLDAWRELEHVSG